MEAGQEIAAAALRQQLDALRQFVDERLLAAQAAVVGPAAAGDARDLQALDAAPVWVRAFCRPVTAWPCPTIRSCWQRSSWPHACSDTGGTAMN